MSLRTALSAVAGGGAAENARRSLAEWDRAQAEVSALLERIGERDGPAATSAAADTSAPGTSSTPGRAGREADTGAPGRTSAAVPRLLRRPDSAA
jgi:hypothetical protein